MLKALVSAALLGFLWPTRLPAGEKERRKTMKLKLDRYKSNKVSTAGRLYVSGLEICSTLEDEHRDVKAAGQTRIPAGIYKLGLRTTGGFHGRYKSRFSRIHKGMIQIMDVPGFTYILIHCGNTHDHTTGCILLGSRVITKNKGRPDEEFQVPQSGKTYSRVYPIIADALTLGEEVTLEIVDMD